MVSEKSDHSLEQARRTLVTTSKSSAELNSYATEDTSAKACLKQTQEAFSKTIVRQFRFPHVLRGLVESLIFAGVFLAAGIISLGVGVIEMLGPMVPVVLVMMFCMVASGVYREEITTSILNLYVHSIYGFFLASFAFLVLIQFLPEHYSQAKFIFFFLFFAFFVMNTMRPILTGTDFMDGGGRRKN